MKKNFLLTICLAVAGVLGVNAQNSVVALHHDGKVTLYAGSATQAAMDASVKGDTLYFSEGTFGGFNVTHGIVVLGSGVNTIVSGNITITGNSAKKDLGDYVFSGLNMLHNFVINDSVNGLKMNQCQMADFEVKDRKVLDAAEICMSYIRGTLKFNGYIDDGNKVYGIEVLNSKINTVYCGGRNIGSVVFTNCNICEQRPSVVTTGDPSASNNIYNNCIIQEARRSTYINCLYKNTYYAQNLLNCWQDGDLSFDNSLNCSYSDEELASKGWIGTNGTVVGITGGVQPYTLELFTPHVTEHKIDVDNVNRTLKVTLKMSGETAQ